jgi:hypothetical protein
MPLNTLQLSYRPRRRFQVPQALKVLIAALAAWTFFLGLAWIL